MQRDFLEKLKLLLQDVFPAEQDFYRTKYRDAGIDPRFIEGLNEETFRELPILTREEIARAPYRRRLYHEKSGLNKMINCEEAKRYFLIHRTLEEIREDNLPLEGTRPLVLLSNVYEAIERCLFFYEHNILPLIGEIYNPAVIYATMRQYNIDNLFIDHAAIINFRGKLLELNLPLKSVTVIDSAFYPDDFEWPRGIQKHFILSTTETGRIAYKCPSSETYHPYPDIFIEPGAMSVITSTRLKACPVIRYKTSLFFEEASTACRCGKPSYRI